MEDTISSPWRKATYSGNGGGNCVETATVGGAVLVRDTTNRTGGTLTFGTDAWRAFLATIKSLVP